MKGNARKTEYRVFLLSLYIILPLLGWHLSGIIIAILGLPIAYLIDLLFPKWKHDLSWNDIELALNNIYKYGSVPCELTILVDDRRIFIYRDEMDISFKNKPPKMKIRIGVRIPLEDWADFYIEEGFTNLHRKYGGVCWYTSDRGPRSFLIFPSDEIEDCKNILKDMFEKSVGGLKPDILAKNVVNSKKHIWIEHIDNENDETAAP